MVQKREEVDRELNRGQLRFAKRFERKEKGRFIYAHGVGWHQWDGTRWAECQVDEADHAVHELLDEARWELPTMATDQDRKEMIQDLVKLETAAGVEGVLKLARSRPAIAVAGANLDTNPLQLNTVSGTVDLESGAIAEHDPDDRITKVTNAQFDPKAQSDVWDAFLETILPDDDVRQFVQRVFGYALLGEVREHMLPIFIGSGANGKTTLQEAFMHAVGDYATVITPGLLLEKRSDAHPTEMLDLKGVRVAFISETDQARKFSLAIVKDLTGGGKLKGRRMHRDFVRFQPSHTIIMMTNNLPEVAGDDPAAWRRLLAVPFNVVIPTNKQDKRLPEKLRRESSAVLAWAYRGWLDYRENGLMPPAAVQTRTEEYQRDSDIIGRFLDEKCVLLGDAVSVGTRELYAHYAKWCLASGEKDISEKDFQSSLLRRGEIKKGSTGGRPRYRGIGLKEDERLRPVS